MAYKELKKYHCGWCRNTFEATAATTGNDKKGKGSNTITCSKCGNNCKTWTDGETIKITSRS